MPPSFARRRPRTATPRVAVLLALLLLALLLPVTAVGAGKIGTRYDKDADYSGLVSYAWRIDNKKPDGSPLARGGEIDTMIRGILAEELERRGFHPAEEGAEADFEISYDAMREAMVDDLALRKDVTRGVAWVVEGDYRSWHKGTLVLSVYRRGDEHAAWSAWTTEKLKDPQRPDPRQVRRVARKLLAGFPPR